MMIVMDRHTDTQQRRRGRLRWRLSLFFLWLRFTEATFQFFHSFFLSLLLSARANWKRGDLEMEGKEKTTKLVSLLSFFFCLVATAPLLMDELPFFFLLIFFVKLICAHKKNCLKSVHKQI